MVLRWALLSLGVVLGVPTLDAIRWDAALRQYVDVQGRVRIFHGVNVIFKKAPWYPQLDRVDARNSLAAEDMDALERWGFNVVRLGTMWPGVEPSPGHIDTTYLATLKGITERLAARGVYSILDLHQDAGARAFCGEGFPDHYITALAANASGIYAKAAAFPAPAHPPLPVDADGMPNLTACLTHVFSDYYATEQNGIVFKQLYTPGTPLNNGFHRFWDAVAGAFAGSPAVLAYELLNEPSSQCLDGCSSLSVRKEVEFRAYTEREYLAPLYASVAETIRAKDADKLILYEATWLPHLAVGEDRLAFPAGPPLGRDPQQGLSYHIYCAKMTLLNEHICDFTHDLFLREFKPFLDQNPAVAGFLTEFGAMSSDAAEAREVTDLLDYADSAFQSWAYWQLKYYNDITTINAAESLYAPDGTVYTEKLRVLSRTYAQAIAGKPEKMHFDARTAAFSLRFEPTLNATTEVYLNEELHYPTGYDVSIQPPECLRLTRAPNRLLLADAGCRGRAVELLLTARERPQFV